MKKFAIALGCIAVLGLIGFAVKRAVNASVDAAAADLDAAIAAAREAGLELEFERALPKASSPANDASKDYLAIRSWTDGLDKETAQARNVVESHRIANRPATDAEIASAMARMDGGIALVSRAAAKPECAFQRDWTEPASVVLPEYAYMKPAAKWLGTAAVLDAKAGNTDAALDKLESMFGIARHASQEPITISLLVAIAVRSIAVHHMLQALEAAPELAGSREFRKQAQRRPLDARYFLPGEVAMAMRTDFSDPRIFTAMAADPEDESAPPKLPTMEDLGAKLIDGDNLNRAARARLLRYWTRVAPLLDPQVQPSAALKGIEALNEEIEAEAQRSGVLGKRVALLVPVWTGLLQAVKADEIRFLLLRRILELESPVAISIGMPPTDPWTGRPIVVERVTGRGYRLRSLGPNRKDDEGRLDDVELCFPVSLKRPRT